MVARFLVTTAIEDTWPATDVPILFLGEWCRLYDRKLAWQKYDSKVVPYHWDDRNKLYNDYQYLRSVYESSLSLLVDRLNTIHNCEYSVRYWRILVGPWLGYFIQALFDRWFMLRKAITSYDILGVNVIDCREDHLVSNDMVDFLKAFVDDSWNEMMYGHVLASTTVSFNISNIPRPNREAAIRKAILCRASSSSLKRSLAKQVSRFLGFFSGNDSYFFLSSYLGIKNDFLLQLSLGQVPQLWRPIDAPISGYSTASRQWKLSNTEPSLTDSHDDFQNLVLNLIPKHIPIAYLEGYPLLQELTKRLQWPQQPKTIFTSNSYLSDDVFKAWTGEKVESGSPLVIGQHGGSFGMSRWEFTEEHQIAIADKFITWGWCDKMHKHVIPIANLKSFSRPSIMPRHNGGALLVQAAYPRYSYHMYSSPVSANQWQSYFEDQCRFVSALPSSIRENVLVRMYMTDYGCNQRLRWMDNFHDVQLDDGSSPFSRLIAHSRILISTYNATSYLESLSMNFPTIFFWNQAHWELRDGIQPYFDRLKSVEIFHESPENAARHLAEVWDNVSEWWYSADVQNAVLYFSENFSRSTDQPIKRMRDIFLSRVS